MNQNEQRQYFEQLVQQHQGIWIKIAHTYCPHESERQDLIQEMMIQVWQALPRYDNRVKISTWLYRIALNVAISAYRKSSQRSQLTVGYLEAGIMSNDHVSHSTDHQLNLLNRFIGELKEIDKALMLLFLEEKSHSEIAEILGLSLTNVGTRLSRIKDRLRQRFSEIKNL